MDFAWMDHWIIYDRYAYVFFPYCKEAYFYSVYRLDNSGKAILDLSQIGFIETLTVWLDYISERLGHVDSDILIWLLRL